MVGVRFGAGAARAGLRGGPAGALAVALTLLFGSPGAPEAAAQSPDSSRDLPTIEEKTAEMERIDGFFPLYWDEREGVLWMEISRFETEVLYARGLATGLGSNDIGLNRGQLRGSRIVEFERVGPRVLMVQPNYRYRASSEDPAEIRAVRDAFARSVLWSFAVTAETDGRVLVDISDFLLQDDANIPRQLRPGTYRLDRPRSSVYLPMTMGFPSNTEMEVELTFVQQPGSGPQVPRFFEGVGSVASTGEAASIRVHHSLVELPDDDYTPRLHDPRAGYGSFTYNDLTADLHEPLEKRFIRRHRLEKADPTAPVSDPVEPIVYYLDPGTPEPMRTALLEGARWWNDAFEAIGYRNAFQVELLPEGASTHDVRYNVINWVNRSTRGWSTGGSITDPRTGEIIKGVVTLGALRVRQDYLLAEGLLAPYERGDEAPDEIEELALARVAQLSAHEVGHTIGLGHNFYASERGWISVMDYPHPLVTLEPDGSVDISRAYVDGIGSWDSVAVAYGYQHFPPGADEEAELGRILEEAWDRDVRYMTNQDMSAHPRVHQWSNGLDAAEELERMLDVRRAALDRFGENAIRSGRPLALMEEVLVPLYLHHRYQVEAAASAVGGLEYIYAMRGDGREPMRRVSAADQRAALDALERTLQPAELALPRSILERLPPRPSGYGQNRELFPRYTGQMFDAVTPAVVAADLSISNLLAPDRAARLVEQHALDPTLPGLDEVLGRLAESTFDTRPSDPYEAEVARAVERVVVERLVALASGAPMPQVRALVHLTLERRVEELETPLADNDDGIAAHRALLARDIRRFMESPGEPVSLPTLPAPPPGAPIGQPSMDWLGTGAPWCSSQEWGTDAGW